MRLQLAQADSQRAALSTTVGSYIHQQRCLHCFCTKFGSLLRFERIVD